MIGGSLYQEVCRRLIGTGDFWSHSGIGGHESSVRQAGPEGPDRRIERSGTSGVDCVIEAVDPLEVGSEPDVAFHAITA